MIDDEDFWELDPDPVKAWDSILTMIEKAETAEEFGRIAALPLNHFWTGHREEFLPVAAAAALRMPELANILIAADRHSAYAMHVMNLIAGDRAPFRYEPPHALAAMVTSGGHPLTERLRIPNVYAGLRREDTPPPNEEEQREIIAGYLADPDEWWVEVDDVARDHPRLAFRMVRAIWADPAADLGRVGAGPLEHLLTYAEDVIREDVLAAMDDERFMKALQFANLFSISDDFLAAIAARLTSRPSAPTFTT